MLDAPAHLFDVEPRARYGFGIQGMNYHLFGDKYLEVPNEPEALVDQLLPEGGRAPAARRSRSRIRPARSCARWKDRRSAA